MGNGGSVMGNRIILYSYCSDRCPSGVAVFEGEFKVLYASRRGKYG